MANPKPSTFSSNVQWKLAKQMRKNDFYSIFCNSAITVSLLKILEMLPKMCLTYTIK